MLTAPLKTVLFRDGGVSRVFPASGAHKLGALRTVRPHVFAHTLRFSARGFLALTKNVWFLEVPLIHLWVGRHVPIDPVLIPECPQDISPKGRMISIKHKGRVGR